MHKNIKIFVYINDWCAKRIARYGAQYRTFAIFSLINYPLSYIYKAFVIGHPETESLILRAIPTVLALGLILKNKWPKNWKPFLPLYWYFTIMISLPFIGAYLLLQNQLSLGWLINIGIGLLIEVLLLDWLSCLFVSFFGAVFGVAVYLLLGHSLSFTVPADNLELFIYMLFCIFVLGSIFSRNKEVAENYLLQEKDKLNEHLQEMVKQRTKALQEELEEKTRFVNNVSHEIKTPVHGLVTVSTFLLDNWDKCTESDRLKWARMISNTSRRLFGLVTNILDMARFNLGKISVEPEKTDLVILVEEMIEECLNLYISDSNRKINFPFDHEGLSEAVIEADALRITQILRNLYANAIRYSDETIETTISAQLKSTKIVYTDGSSEDAFFFSITDQGVGIPEDYLEKIFDVFVESSRTVAKSGGTGLGLALCKEIVEAHCGVIWAENNPGGIGSKFSFVIPSKFLGVRVPKMSMLTATQASKMPIFASAGVKKAPSKQVLSFRNTDI